MLARLSSSDYPALAPLTTRDDDDFTIAFLDATAMVLDVLTFYQERLANESYLRTAGQSRSLTELSRLIGYQPSPGVSASTYVAFSLKAAPGQTPAPSAPPITIPQGTQIQSVPSQGQTAQTFETSAPIQAKVDWSALPVQTAQPWIPPGTANNIYLTGTSTKLQPGDALLVLGIHREQWDPSISPIPSEQWLLAIINQVRVDPVRNLTYLSWDTPLKHETGGTATLMEVTGVDEPTRDRNKSTTSRPILPFALRSRFRIMPRESSWAAAKVFALRQKATLFGYNAPNPNLFVNSNPSSPNSLIDPSNQNAWQWKKYNIASPNQIDLDATYPKIVASSWFALTSYGVAQLFKVQSTRTVALSNFGVSGKVTELSADYQDPSINPGPAPGASPGTFGGFTIPGTEVWAQSDPLEVAEQPLTYPVYGNLLDLQDLRPDLLGPKVVAVFGKRQKIAVANGIIGLAFIPDDGSASVPLVPGDILTLVDPRPLPLAADGAVPDWSAITGSMTLSVGDANGRTGGVVASLSQFVLVPSGQNDPDVSECAVVSALINLTDPYPHTQIQLQSNLTNCYDRTVTTVNANVALATHGRSVSEIMGSGSAATPNQSFALKQSPLTYVQAPTPTGKQSTLEVQANGVAWKEVPSLYAAGSSQQVFAILNQSDGTTDVLFGDGAEGAPLPSGQNNLQANYRVGLGSAGNVPANTLTTLLDRPLGVSGVTNPEAATGGQDPEPLTGIRSNAPLAVLTLGRAVSIADYQNYASTFAGLAKAYAIWIPSGHGQGVFLTVAGVNGVALHPGDPTLSNLVASLKNYGNPLVPITVQSFVETVFGLSADVRYDPSYNQPAVQAQILQALSNSYGFAERNFGQSVTVDEISSVIQNVPGVVAVNITGLSILASSTAGDLAGLSKGFSLTTWNSWIAQQVSVPRASAASTGTIEAYLPTADPQALPLPAEILVLDPDPGSVVLGVMP